MVLGPFARIIAQVGFIAGGALFRAFIQAYREAAMRGAANPAFQQTFSRKMSLDEASKILEIDFRRTGIEEIVQRFHRLHEINAKKDNFPGSPYLQRKVEIAKEVLEDHIRSQGGGGGQKP
ncbi:unnamed protein product [Vitrella brassicaformis CCMP3155]|uniref:Presequence translocated-associated motor subunit PAM16 n=1 Tax=Vitrella brassicaformis (strain CCMP3155) TaxID=1169540 RepID=A0A0G4EIX9_VITBC|nr:unnamed protein product [Vitrella brassicaformis CCMP3155]|mmetsp:Transcript_19871/g.48193  ORF Transcript_19871/g.48193 Transcript_19871/m.48193 type:complete len:121 (+) Transcript_19871:128-490(+)|eukprot:CEL96971.1 unnamed protein product [Vitrella brassicaformis CCMP3155]